eukprot:61569_1
MSSQSITKQSMREMTTGFSLFSTEQKNESVSPRKVFKAKRRYSHNNAPLNHTNDQIFTTDRDSKFTQMTDTQYKEYQQCSMSKRMKRKRNFDVFSSGSNLSLNEILQSAQTFRIPHYALFYVRVDTDCNTNTQMERDDGDAQRIMNEKHIVYPSKEECSITRSVRVSSDWVCSYNAFELAENKAWKELNPKAKIHEYQINRLHGIILLNLDKTGKDLQSIGFENNEQDIKQWVLDHGCCGFILDSCFHLYQPHLYWNLVDDNKELKVKQTLISDMFQSTKTKPKNVSWKANFE